MGLTPIPTGSAAHMTGGEQNAKLSVGSALPGLRVKRRLADFLSYPLEHGIMRRSSLTLGGKKERWWWSWRGHTSEPEQVKMGQLRSMAAA